MGQFLDMSLQTAGDLLGKFLLFKIKIFLMILRLTDPAQDLGPYLPCPGWWRALEWSDWLKGRGGRTTLANSFKALLIGPCSAQGMEGV